jgi:ATP-dependent DNA helicase RecG
MVIHADETPVMDTTLSDVDLETFHHYLEKELDEEPPADPEKMLCNMNLMREGCLTTAGVLLFAKRPQRRLPAFMVKAMAFPGDSVASEVYTDSREIEGRLRQVFDGCVAFLQIYNVHRQPADRSVNSIGEPVIPKIVFEELVANALIHRDYFISAPIRLLKFADRFEIISPGHLPNNLTVENIKAGNSNMRNPILASYAARLLPYRGIGSGVRRALAAYDAIDFIDDREGNMFKVVIRI